MSESIKRRSSSRQLLQNLIRVTAQRSQEDAEEVERERRRRARDKQRGEEGFSWPEPPQHSNLLHSTESVEELKPSCCLVLEEDEGFSDWSHRLEHRHEQEVQDDCRAKQRRPVAPPGLEKEKEQGKEEEQKEGEELELEQSRQSEAAAAATRPPDKAPSTKKESRTSYSSSVFLTQDARLHHATGRSADRTSYLAAGTMKPRGGSCRVDGELEQEVQTQQEEAGEKKPTLHREWRPAVTQQSPKEEEEEEEEEDEDEELKFTHGEEDFHFRREPKHVKEELKEEGHKVQTKRSGEIRDRRTEEANTESDFSVCSSVDSEEPLNCYGPMSPTFKKLLIQFYPDEANSRVSTDGKCTIIERTESLRRSTSNIKKTPPPAPISKIDKKLELYTHALEVSSKDGRSGCQPLADLMSPTEPVASKKNMFEAREACNQNNISVTPHKDADVLKVGVADLINQWVKGSEDGSRCNSPFKPAESSLGKKYKFVVTGHGKYEKISIDDGCSDDVSCQSAGPYYEDL